MNITVFCADNESPKRWSKTLYNYYNDVHEYNIDYPDWFDEEDRMRWAEHDVESDPPKWFKDQNKVRVSGLDDEHIIISFREEDDDNIEKLRSEDGSYLIWRRYTANNIRNGIVQLASSIAQLYYNDRRQ